ncbi:MAG: HAD family hydrolase [Dehalococcoidales bacterium]|nr:HAD family hydrolase [Dehalococcoidales bacterium]
MKLPKFATVPDAVALDLDGTLFDKNEQISPRNRRALDRCFEMGIPVILATSRPARNFHSALPEELIEKCSYTVLNGAVIKGNPPLSGYMKTPIPENIVREVLAISYRHYPDIQILTEIEGFEFGADWNENAENTWIHNPAMQHLIMPIEESIRKQPSKIVISGTEEQVIHLQEAINSKIGDSLTIVPALKWKPILNITNPEVTKTYALKQLLEPVGRSLENTVAFGDDFPDLDMLQSCGFGVAMGNAFPELKEACKYSTMSNEVDGVAMVLERIPGFFEPGDNLGEIQENLKFCH